MTSEDVPSALALVNKYSSQFEIRQVFSSEEFSHHFLSPAVPNYVFTFVVKNEVNKITDLLTYTLDTYNVHRQVAIITTVVSTYIPIEQLIMDGTISARDSAEFVAIGQQGSITKDVLLSLSFHPVVSVDFYFNHEIPESNFFIFLL